MKLIQTKEYLLLIDEEAEIKEGVYYLTHLGNIYRETERFFEEDEGVERFSNRSSYKPILAYYPLNSKVKELDLPLLPNPFNKEVDETTLLKNLGHECFLKMKELNPSGGIKEFIRMAVEFGYKTAQSKQFSLDDIKKAFHTGRLYQGREGDTSLEELIQSLSTQQLPKEFIPEYEKEIVQIVDNESLTKTFFKGVDYENLSKDVGVKLRDERGGLWGFPTYNRFKVVKPKRLKTITNSEGKQELVGTYK